jgi:predicted AlkP superfamily pyrophosphatase or phosphodiesterase
MAALFSVFLVVASGCNRPDRSGTSPGEVEVADAQAPTAGRNAPEWIDAPYVVLVSLDGFSSRYVQQLQPATISAMAEQGVWAERGLTPVYPTKTFPNHYSLATGLHPAKHGIVGNTFYDAERDDTYRISDREKVEDGTWYDGEPLWVTAERQGMVAACYYWVGSEADVAGVRPSHWRIHDQDMPNSDRVNQVLDWLAYPAEFRPHFLTLYFSVTDNVGHDFGPDSPELAAAVVDADRELGRLMAGIEALNHGDQVSVVVVSDHGMDGYTPETTAYIADAVGDMGGIRATESGPHSNLWVDGGPERVREVRDAINEGLEHVSAYLADETPEGLHYRNNPRIGDIVLVPDSGWVVYPVNDRPARTGFTHGWDSRNLAMRALMVAAGPRLTPGGRINEVSAVDIYPLVAELLGLTPAAGLDGSLEPWRGVLDGG